jgi:hypothetical protein
MPSNIRNLRVNQPLWDAGHAKAAEEDTTLSAAIVGFLEDWTGVTNDPAAQPEPAVAEA